MMKATTMSLALLAVGACATVTIPPDRLTSDEASIRSAEELGASDVPEAKLHLQLARDETQTAKRMAADGDGRAVVLLARAESDAELALALAREVAVHAEAAKAADDLEAVQARVLP